MGHQVLEDSDVLLNDSHDNRNDDQLADQVLEEEPLLMDGRNTPEEIERGGLALLELMAAETAISCENESIEVADMVDLAAEDEDLSFAQKRKLLNEFYSNRVRSGMWPKTTLPKKGKDKDFDEFLASIGLEGEKGKTYAARRWKIFKDENGYDAPIISKNVVLNEGNLKQTIEDYQATHNTTIVSNALVTLQQTTFTGLNEQEQSLLLNHVQSHDVLSLSLKGIEDITHQFSLCISGVRHYSSGY